MNVEEARQKLEDVAGSFYLARTSIMEAADAYGAARELKGHVDACHDAAGRVSITGKGLGAKFRECGDGWLCDVGREIEERR